MVKKLSILILCIGLSMCSIASAEGEGSVEANSITQQEQLAPPQKPEGATDDDYSTPSSPPANNNGGEIGQGGGPGGNHVPGGPGGPGGMGMVPPSGAPDMDKQADFNNANDTTANSYSNMTLSKFIKTYQTPIISVVLLILGFVFVKLFRKRNY